METGIATCAWSLRARWSLADLLVLVGFVIRSLGLHGLEAAGPLEARLLVGYLRQEAIEK